MKRFPIPLVGCHANIKMERFPLVGCHANIKCNKLFCTRIHHFPSASHFPAGQWRTAKYFPEFDLKLHLLNTFKIRIIPTVVFVNSSTLLDSYESTPAIYTCIRQNYNILDRILLKCSGLLQQCTCYLIF